jgi:6-phosphogluconolactonase/glucosamine-6-phosphate isomerase/deaminase
LTLVALARAGLVCVAAFGAAKAVAVREAIDADSPLPAARALRGGERALVLLDPSAASRLEKRSGSSPFRMTRQ